MVASDILKNTSTKGSVNARPIFIAGKEVPHRAPAIIVDNNALFLAFKLALPSQATHQSISNCLQIRAIALSYPENKKRLPICRLFFFKHFLG